MWKAGLGFIVGLLVGALGTYKMMEKKLDERFAKESEEMRKHYMDQEEENAQNCLSPEEIREYEEAASKYTPLSLEVNEAFANEDGDFQESGCRLITKEEYEENIDKYKRVELNYYIQDDVFTVANDPEQPIFDIRPFDVDISMFDFRKRAEIWTSENDVMAFKIKYINKAYKTELGFNEPPAPAATKKKKSE